MVKIVDAEFTVVSDPNGAIQPPRKRRFPIRFVTLDERLAAMDKAFGTWAGFRRYLLETALTFAALLAAFMVVAEIGMAITTGRLLPLW